MSTVRVLARVRDANGVVSHVEWFTHPWSTFRIEHGNVTIYEHTHKHQLNAEPQASYPPGEYLHVEVRGSEHNPQSR